MLGAVVVAVQRLPRCCDMRRFMLMLIGERFFHYFRSLEIIGDMYQYTEALCRYS